MKISIAKAEEIDDIQSFIGTEWKNNHILSRDKFFFKHEYLFNNKLNFIIAKLDDKIEGVLGFIPSKIYRKNKINYIEENSDYCATLWKVKKNSNYPSVGLKLLQKLRDIDEMGSLFCVGINEKTLGIYKYLNIYTGLMNQYVIINDQIKDFKIAKISKRLEFQTTSLTDKRFSFKIINNKKELSNFKFEKFKNSIPYKNKTYFIKRYFDYPHYRYKVFGVYFQDNLKSLFVTRTQHCNGAKALRIIDFYGNQKNIKPFSSFLRNYIVKENYEYVDFYCFGLDNLILENAGFKLINQYSNDLIIPNYFNPFLQKNIPIRFFLDSKEIDRLLLFKGDGDQDRPS